MGSRFTVGFRRDERAFRFNNQNADVLSRREKPRHVRAFIRICGQVLSRRVFVHFGQLEGDGFVQSQAFFESMGLCIAT